MKTLALLLVVLPSLAWAKRAPDRLMGEVGRPILAKDGTIRDTRKPFSPVELQQVRKNLIKDLRGHFGSGTVEAGTVKFKVVGSHGRFSMAPKTAIKNGPAPGKRVRGDFWITIETQTNLGNVDNVHAPAKKTKRSSDDLTDLEFAKRLDSPSPTRKGMKAFIGGN